MITQVSADTIDKVQYFKKLFESLGYADGHFVFACHAAFPIALTPDLLYQLWGNFKSYNRNGKLQLVDAMAISDVLLSPLCREVSRDVFEMDMETRAYLLNELETDSRFGRERMKKLGYFLYQYIHEVAVGKHDDAFINAQSWTALASIAPEYAAQSLATTLKEAVENRDDNEVLRLRNLLESYTNQESGFENLLHYTKGLKAAILDYPEAVVQDQMNRSDAKVLTIEEGASTVDTILEILLLEDWVDKVEIPEEVVSSSAEEKALFRINKEKETQTGTLDLKSIGLTEIPPEVFDLDYLKVLDLYGNKIEILPKEFTQLKNLESLMMSRNPVAEIPSFLKEMESLKIFKLDGGKLKDFPEVLLQMRGIENISLEDNQIDFLPPAIAKLENLKLLDLRKNPVVNLPEKLHKRTGQTIRDYFKEYEPETTGGPVLLYFSELEDGGEMGRIKSTLEKQISAENPNALRLIDAMNISALEFFQYCYKYQNQLLVLHYTAIDMSFLKEESLLQKLKPSLLLKLIGKPKNCKLIIFNADHSVKHAEVIGESLGIACVGVDGRVENRTALKFTKDFYSLLAEGKSFAGIFDLLRNEI